MTDMPPLGVPTPEIAAAICSSGSIDLIGRQLDALGGQSLGLGAFEIILAVGDNQRANIWQLIEARPHLSVKVIDCPEPTQAVLRNAALAQTSAPVILFLNEFDLPGSSLLAQHAHSHRLYPEATIAIQGYTGVDPELAQRPIAEFMAKTGRLGASYAGALSDRWLDGSWFAEGRCSCKCALLNGGISFNPALSAGAEWADLAQRLAPQRLRILYNSRAISSIIGPTSLEEFCLESERQGQSDRALIRRYPDAILARKLELLRSNNRVERLRARLEHLFAITRRLDEIAEARIQHDIELDADFKALLHTHYADTLDAFWLRGVAAAEAQPDRMIA